MTTRLDSTERRNAIVDAALPLFAKKGFAATTVREIAAAAGVSEALIFKHFPTKAALYDAILGSCFEGDEDLAALLALEPSTQTLVAFVEALLDHYLVEVPTDPDETARHRLYVISLLDDAEFAGVVCRWMREAIIPRVIASVRAAEASGDLVPAPVPVENRAWFAEQLGVGLANLRLPRPAGAGADLPCRDAAVGRHAMWFLLRGIGMTDAALARYGLTASAANALPAHDDTKDPQGAGS